MSKSKYEATVLERSEEALHRIERKLDTLWTELQVHEEKLEFLCKELGMRK